MQISPISFGSKKHAYKHFLKEYFKEGLLPTVQKGFYGGKLSPRTVSLEHLKPHSQGGRTELKNVVLATRNRNTLRGNKKLSNVINPVSALRYLKQFRDVRLGNFDGNKYIELITKTLQDMGIYLSAPGVHKKLRERPFKKTAHQLNRKF